MISFRIKSKLPAPPYKAPHDLMPAFFSDLTSPTTIHPHTGLFLYFTPTNLVSTLGGLFALLPCSFPGSPQGWLLHLDLKLLPLQWSLFWPLKSSHQMTYHLILYFNHLHSTYHWYFFLFIYVGLSLRLGL